MKVRVLLPTFATSSKKFILPWLLCLLALFPINIQAQEKEEKEPGMFINIFMDWIALSYATHTGETYGEAIGFFSDLLETYKARPDLKPLLSEMKDFVASNALQVGSGNFYNNQGIRIYFIGKMEYGGEKKYVNGFNKLLASKTRNIQGPYLIVKSEIKGTHLTGYKVNVSIEGSPEIKMGKYDLDKTNDKNPFHQVKGEFTTRSEMGKSVRRGLLAGLNTLIEEVKSLKSSDEETKETEEPYTLDNNAVDSISTTPPEWDLTTVQSKLIYEVLVEIDIEIGNWLDNLLGPLPRCLPEGPALNQLSQEKVSFYIQSTQDLVDSIRTEVSNVTVLDSLAYNLTDTLDYKSQLTGQKWKEIRGMICPFVLEEDEGGSGTDSLVGLTYNGNTVSINNISNSFTIEKERLEFTYTIKDTLGLAKNKLEIFRITDNDSALVTSYSDLPLGEGKEFQDQIDNK